MEGKSKFTAQPPWWPAAGMKQWGRGSVRRGGAAGGFPLYGRHARAPGHRRSSRLNSPYGVSLTDERRESGGGPVGIPERDGRRGQGLHVAEHGLQGSSECSPPRAAWPRDGARALTLRRAQRSRRRARRATPWRGTGRPNVLQCAGLNAWMSKKLNRSAPNDE
jgi:hypothetical protein